MLAPIMFTLPPEEQPELGIPLKIEHGCDYMLLPDGKLEYYYNFLIYSWHLGEEEIQARTYLDGSQHQVSVFVKGTRLISDAALQPMVRYLQRRFMLIQSFHPDDTGPEGTGYRLVFKHERYKDPE
jgi:hypothetical protein